MKRLLILILLLSSTFHLAFSQTKIVDSLRKALERSTNAIDRFHILDMIALESNTRGLRLDSLIIKEMLQIAQQKDNDSLLAISYNWLGTLFYSKADNLTALEYYFKGIPYAKRVGDKRRVSSFYFDMALVYFDLGNEETAFAMNQEGKANLPPPDHPLFEFMLRQYHTNSAQYYLIKKQVDSALHYANQFSDIRRSYQGNESQEFLRQTFFASSYALSGDASAAREHFAKAFALIDLNDRKEDWLLLYKNYIPFLLNNDQKKEALAAARSIYEKGIIHDNINLRLGGAELLRLSFDALGRSDSAYHYSKIASELRSVILSTNNKNKLENLAFAEELRSFEEGREKEAYRNKIIQYTLVSGLLIFLLVAFILYLNNKQKHKANRLLATAMLDLKSTQSQLIQSEKMASLGELTAGIAHEIQNPLNFVNNFSEINNELIEEVKSQKSKLKSEEVDELLADIYSNNEKILHHGKRADAIVKGMLQHSRASSAVKESTDLNALADEYLRLCYHGLRAKNKSFNAAIRTDFDEAIGNINIVPQDIGRVLLNLLTNAFYAVNEKQKTVQANSIGDYEPTVSICTKKLGRGIEIEVTDNGNGIPRSSLDKIFQPFYTTKPTGQGTGLGLSLSYDIITKGHGGEIKVETKENEGATFKISLPLN